MPVSGSVFASAVRRGGGFTIIAALVLGAFSGCDDSPAAPPTSIPVEFRISAGVGEGDPGRSVVVDAYYRRTGGDEVALAVEPATIDVENGSVAAGTVTVDVLPCVRDTNHEPMSGSSADGCRVYVVARLLAPNGTPVSEEEIAVPVARSVRSVIVDAFELPSG